MPGIANTVAKSAGSFKKTNPYANMTSPMPGQRTAGLSGKTSPFKLPNDEEVFLQREAEKIKLQELK
jgi:hypothetical protein